MKILYITPSLYIPGGVERVLTTKMNWLVENTDWEVYVCLTDGEGKAPYYPLDPRVKVINLNIGFEELWHLPFYKKVFVYLKKQRTFKKKLKELLFEIRPDITDSLLRREINFINDIKDGSAKIGELHVNRKNYRNFEANETNLIKDLFSKYWMYTLVQNLKKLDRFIVLSQEDADNWAELDNLHVIPNPINTISNHISTTNNKNIIAVGRYTYQKGFDLLLEAWKTVHQKHPDWTLDVYGRGDKTPFQEVADQCGGSVHLNDATNEIQKKYAESSIYVLSSRFEGFGMVLVEAMNCGVPCVSFACPCGPKNIITDGVDGLLVPPEDTNALAEKICWMIEHPVERKQMGTKALETSMKYHVDNIMPEWVELFKELYQEKK